MNKELAKIEPDSPAAITLPIASAPPPWGFNQPIYSVQLVGTALLLGVIVFLNWTKEKAPPVVVRPLSVAEGTR